MICSKYADETMGKILNINWCGCETDEEMVAIANKRLSQVQGSLF